MDMTLERAKKIVSQTKIEKCPFLENAKTYVVTEHHPASKAPQGDVVIYPYNEVRASRNPQDFGFAIKYYPNCDDPSYVGNTPYKPRVEEGLTYDYENATEDDIIMGLAVGNCHLGELMDKLRANPTYPPRLSYERIRREYKNDAYAKEVYSKEDTEFRKYFCGLFNSKICLLVKGHPHFGVDWNTMKNNASSLPVDDFINRVQRSIFNAHCLIRVIDHEYYREICRGGYDPQQPWSHNCALIKTPSDAYTSKIKANAKALNQRYKSAPVTIDRDYTMDYLRKDNPSPDEWTPYELFLHDLGIMNTRTDFLRGR